MLVKQNTPGKKPKEIILCDWRVADWPESKKQQVRNWLLQLKNQGFTIHVWRNDTLHPMNLNERECDLSDVRSLDKKEVQAHARAKLKIPDEQIAYLDAGMLEYLLNNEPLVPGKFSLQELLRLPDRDQAWLINQLKKEPPGLSELVVDVFSTEATAVSAQLQSEFPGAHLSFDLKEMDLSGKGGTCHVKNGSLYKDEAKLELSEQRLASLESCDLTHFGLSSDVLPYLFTIAPRLKNINLKCCTGINSTVFTENSLQQLEECRLSAAAIDSDFLKRFLNAAPNLKIVSLRHCKKLVATDF